MAELSLVVNGQDQQQDGNFPSLTTSVYHSLRADLMSGVFPSGVRLGIRVLQERYGTGATPIREVLNRLTAEGFVQQIDQKGFRVPRFSHHELAELIRARCLLNEIIFREVIANSNDSTDEAMIVALFRLTRASKVAEKYDPSNSTVEEAHKHFHQTLIAPCRSPWLIGFSERLFDLTTRYRVLAAPKQADPDEDHRLIMEAILDRDVERAVNLNNIHVQNVGYLAEASLNSLVDIAV